VSRSRTSSRAEPRGVPIVISGPAGAGKTVVADAVAAKAPWLAVSVSATSRPRRPGERDGEDYHFLSREEFQRRLDRGDLLEHTEHIGNYYGTLREAVEKELDAGRDVLLTLDIRGGDAIRAAFADSILVFLLPPSMDVLEERLRERKRDPESEILHRLEIAERELRSAGRYDYLVINDVLEEAVSDVLAIARASRLSRERILNPLVAAGVLPRNALPAPEADA